MTIRNILLASFVSLHLVACGGGTNNTDVSTPDTPAPPSPPSSVPDIVADMAQSVDGVIVYVEQREKEPLIATAGISNRETQSPISAQQLFKTASISKLFIAVAATKLINEGAFQLQDSLALWLPELAERIENSHSITIEQIIQHRSGIPDFDSQTGFSWQAPHTNIDNTLAYALDKPADFAPNERYEYSNTNYLLLAKIMDTALGYSHYQYIDDNILAPLDLSNTYHQLEQVNPEELVSGYWENIDRKTQDYVIPGGSMIATAQNVATFLRALNTGSLLNTEERQLYRYWYSHSGWLPGYQSVANYYPDIDAVVVVFVNSTGNGSENIMNTGLSQILSFLKDAT